MTRGSGSDANPLDGCRIYVGIELRDGKVRTINARVDQPLSGPPSSSPRGCQTARRACATLPSLVLNRTADEAGRVGAMELLRALLATGIVDAAEERCILTTIGALRSALIDAHVAALAEATVEAKKLSVR